jgi:hypothetical protein
LAGGALLGAGAGALYSGITGDGNILNSALTGALLGGTVGGIGAAFAPAAAGGTGLTAATPLTGAGSLAPTTVSTASPALAATKGSLAASAAAPAGVTATQTAAGLGAIAPGAAPVASTYGTLAGAAAPAGLTATQTAAGLGAGAKTAAAGMTGKQMLATGLAGTTALSLLGSRNQPKLSPGTGTTPSYIRPYTYSSTPNTAGGEYPSPYPSTPLYDAKGNPILDTRERRYFDQTFTAGEPYKAANGGLMAAGGPVERMSQMNTAINPQGGMYPQGMIDKTQYALPTQRPTSMEVLQAMPQRTFADGGVTGYAIGGFLSQLFQKNTSIPKNNNITYDAAAQRYSGLPTPEAAPAGDSTPLAADIIAQLIPQYQAANPNAFSYDPVKQRYGAVNPNMMQLNAFKTAQDQKAAEEAAAAAQASQPYDVGGGGGGANGGLMRAYAMGGNVQGYNLGGYSDGGRLLRGPGDGVSDDIPATIGNRQPARLADGEFVIPARIVSELGNGSTDAGAKRLYAMMDRIQAGRKKTVGKGNVAKDTKAKKHLLA